ncbi:unnamed protein product [Ostreobium quekettii]|uniref:Sec1-like protein n=1 Tax=Ostreobium quekettii TaxID=121088 RepID=A0A8S1J8V8_9CHLO|nr:unnamed protein product [Ostreobium quekettii]
MVLNVRQKQIDAVVKLLHFNQPPSGVKADNSTGTYKVLILDKFSKDLLSPLLHVNDLRKHGVTLHLGIEAVRQPISEVPAVYLVQPTQANVAAIVADTEKELYEQMYINFVPAVPHNLLEELAEGVVKTPNGAGRIAKVFDQYLAFVALEKNLFSLSMPRCYAELNDPSARDTEIEATVSTVVDGLFSVFLTLGAVPIIRCPKGGAPEHIAAALDAKMRDALKLRNNLFSEASSGLVASIARPLLVLFDRDFDLSVAVQHTFSYKPLVQVIACALLLCCWHNSRIWS